MVDISNSLGLVLRTGQNTTRGKTGGTTRGKTGGTTGRTNWGDKK